MKLKAVVEALSDSLLGYISSRRDLLVVADPTDLSLRDASGKAVVFMKANSSGQFGIYFPETTTDTVDGTNVATDLNGSTFVLFR